MRPFKTLWRWPRVLACSGLLVAATSIQAQADGETRNSQLGQQAGATREQVHAQTPGAPSGGTVGQRQTRLDTARIYDPLTRISTRIENRIDTRIHSRIDRGYQGLDNLDLSLRNATEQTQVEGKKSSR